MSYRVRFLYYLLSFTWGLPSTLAGLLFAFVLLCCGKRPTMYGPCICFTCGKNFGGLCTGIVMIVCRTADDRLKNHELGHSLQNLRFGFLMPFLVSAPSSLRYHTRRIIRKLFPKKCMKPYDSVWFEGQATRLGTAFMAQKYKTELFPKEV